MFIYRIYNANLSFNDIVAVSLEIFYVGAAYRSIYFKNLNFDV